MKQIIPVPNFPGWHTYGPDSEWFYIGITKTKAHKRHIGQVVTVRASKFLGVGRCKAKIVGYGDQGYVVLKQAEASQPNFGPGDEFDISFDRYILVGPPLHGKLVRAG